MCSIYKMLYLDSLLHKATFQYFFLLQTPALQWHCFLLGSARGSECFSLQCGKFTIISDPLSTAFRLHKCWLCTWRCYHEMMDEVAGIVAFRHCKSNVVTASIGKFLTFSVEKCYCCNLLMNILKLQKTV